MFSKRSTKEFYVDLEDDRYYSPGETVRGDIVLDLSKPTKINLIRVVFAGTIQVGSNTLTLFSRESEIAAEPGGARQLEAKSNRFPFEVNIPAESSELPTSMKLGVKSDNVAASVRYTITASLHRPFIPQALAPTDIREVSIVEPVDVSLSQYDRPVPAKKEDGKTSVGGTSLLVSIPKAAYVRGDIMPVLVIVQGDYPFAKAHAIRMVLVRRIYFCGKGRRELVESENASKSVKFDVDLVPDHDFSQETLAKIYLPPSLAPTTGPSGRILRVEYSVRVSFDSNLAKTNTQEWKKLFELSKDLPIIIGTTPKADISIDDDDEEENVDDDTGSEGVLHDGIEDVDINDNNALVSGMANVGLGGNYESGKQSAEIVAQEDTKSPSRVPSPEGHHTSQDQTRSSAETNDGPTKDDDRHSTMEGSYPNSNQEKWDAITSSPYPTIESATAMELQAHSKMGPHEAMGSQPYNPTSPIMMPVFGGRHGGNDDDDSPSSYQSGQSATTTGVRMPEPARERSHSPVVADHVSVMPTPCYDAHLPPLPPRSPQSSFVQMPSAHGYDHHQPPSSPSPPFMQTPSLPGFPQPHYDHPQSPPRIAGSPVLFHPIPTGMAELHRPISPIPKPKSPEPWVMPEPSHHHHNAPYPEPAPPPHPYWNQ